MTDDEMIEMYVQVSEEFCNEGDSAEWCFAGVGKHLKLFAKLVAAKEREACAKVCDDMYGNSVHWFPEAAAAIRARGKE